MWVLTYISHSILKAAPAGFAAGLQDVPGHLPCGRGKKPGQHGKGKQQQAHVRGGKPATDKEILKGSLELGNEHIF